MIGHIIGVTATFINACFVYADLWRARFGETAAASGMMLYVLLALYGLDHGRGNDVAFWSSLALFLIAAWLGRFGGGDWLRKKGTALRSSLTAIGEAAFRRDVRATG